MKVNLFSIFPELFDTFSKTSLIGKAVENKIISFNTINIREYGIGKRKSVDDSVYGGDGGMLMRPDVLSDALLNNIDQEIITEQKEFGINSQNPIIITSAKGRLFNQKFAQDLSQKKSLSIICGRFEGVDQRFIDHYNITEVRIGDYVLFGGEIAAMTMIESTTRLINGVIGNNGAERVDSFSDPDTLEYPQYTKPNIWNDLSVPEVLLSGHHEKIKEWRKKNSESTS